MPWGRCKRMCFAIKPCHCERSEAIHTMTCATWLGRDCFAALAMTSLRNDRGCFTALAMTNNEQ